MLLTLLVAVPIDVNYSNALRCPVTGSNYWWCWQLPRSEPIDAAPGPGLRRRTDDAANQTVEQQVVPFLLACSAHICADAWTCDNLQSHGVLGGRRIRLRLARASTGYQPNFADHGTLASPRQPHECWQKVAKLHTRPLPSMRNLSKANVGLGAWQSQPVQKREFCKAAVPEEWSVRLLDHSNLVTPC